MARGATAERRATREAPVPGGREAYLRQRDEFGGLNWGSAFFGWLVSIGVAALLIAILGAAGAAIGLTQTSPSQAGGRRRATPGRSGSWAASSCWRSSASPTTRAATWRGACLASTARARDSACG